MTKKLYLECNSGISGDMTVAALIDLGVNKEKLLNILSSIPINGYDIVISRVKKSGIDCCDFHVQLDSIHENHDHDMEYLHGHSNNLEHHNHHNSNGFHNHTHEEYHHHDHRGIKEIREIIAKTQMSDTSKTIANKIFDIIATSEAKAHNVSIDDVHFHEVGAIDSIVDIIAVAVCLDELNIHEVIVPKLCEGHGTIRCQHGILPIPVPAVSNIVSMYSIPLEFIDEEGEFVTPTGAAIVAAVCSSHNLPSTCQIKRVGIGAGKRTYKRPSIIRAMIVEDCDFESKDTIYKLESNIDDSTGEALGYVMDLLFEAGAKDVHYHPVFMKKNRPAWQLNVICSKNDISKLEKVIFENTTTIGIRRIEMERSILKREMKEIQTPYGLAKVKVCFIDELPHFYPEYSSVLEICKKNHLSYQENYHMIVCCCKQTVMQ